MSATVPQCEASHRATDRSDAARTGAPTCRAETRWRVQGRCGVARGSRTTCIQRDRVAREHESPRWRSVATSGQVCVRQSGVHTSEGSGSLVRVGDCSHTQVVIATFMLSDRSDGAGHRRYKPGELSAPNRELFPPARVYAGRCRSSGIRVVVSHGCVGFVDGASVERIARSTLKYGRSAAQP